MRNEIITVFYGLSACSWVPHWACHYYRLETNSTFVVGNWSFSPTESVLSLLVYSLLIAANLLAISASKLRVSVSAVTGLCHVLIGSIHLYRLWNPFTFEVFGHTWTSGASLREALVVVPFGLLCGYIAFRLRYKESIK